MTKSLRVIQVIFLTMVLAGISCRRSNPVADGNESLFWITYDDLNQIHFIKDDGTDDMMLITSDSLSYTHSCPLISPDNKLLFMFRKKIGPWGFQAAVLDLNTKDTKVVYQFPKDSWITCYVSWSSTSNYVAIVGPNWEWRVISRDGTTNLVPEMNVALPPVSWSPREDKLAYLVSTDNAVYRTTVYDVATGIRQALPDSMGQYNWSPDGESMLATYSRKDPADTSQWLSDLFEYNLRTHGVRQLTFDNRSRMGYYSPDGEKIAYVSRSSSTGENTLNIMQLSNKESRVVAYPSGSDTLVMPHYSWSPNSKKICYWQPRSGRDGGNDVYVVNDDGTGLHLLKKNIYNASWGPRLSEFTPF